MSIEVPRNLKGCAHPKSKLQPGQDEEIRQRYELGVSQRQLAREYRISQMTVFRIVWRVSYDAD